MRPAPMPGEGSLLRSGLSSVALLRRSGHCDRGPAGADVLTAESSAHYAFPLQPAGNYRAGVSTGSGCSCYRRTRDSYSRWSDCVGKLSGCSGSSPAGWSDSRWQCSDGPSLGASRWGYGRRICADGTSRYTAGRSHSGWAFTDRSRIYPAGGRYGWWERCHGPDEYSPGWSDCAGYSASQSAGVVQSRRGDSRRVLAYGWRWGYRDADSRWGACRRIWSYCSNHIFAGWRDGGWLQSFGGRRPGHHHGLLPWPKTSRRSRSRNTGGRFGARLTGRWYR